MKRLIQTVECKEMARLWLQQPLMVLVAALCLGNVALAPVLMAAEAGNVNPGLNLSVAMVGSGKATDELTVPNVWLYVPQGKSPTPFLTAGKFTAVWRGLLTVEKGGDCQFGAEMNGSVKLEINGQTVLEATTNGTTELSKPAQLKEGGNTLRARFTSPEQGDAFLRLRWLPKGSFLHPIPIGLLSRAEDDPDAGHMTAIHLGRELFIEYRCARCHALAAGSGIPELAMDSPAFEGIGGRRNQSWMARWIEDPKALRGTTHMPKLLHGATAKQDAESIAAFLASLKTEASVVAPAEPNNGQAGAGKALFESLHCSACHNAPEATEPDATKISLSRVREKFSAGSMVGFLQKPDAQYAWIRMPNFRLSSTEAEQLAAYLISVADKPKDSTTSSSTAEMVERGRRLVQSSGCLNCHALKLENQHAAPSLAALTTGTSSRGCLAAGPEDAGKAPQFGFAADERAALRAFLGTDKSSLARHVVTEFAERQTRLLNCRGCHGTIEGVPAFDVLGGKLKPEWAGAFIGGGITNRLRTWLEARMPAFSKPAMEIAQGMAMSHGYPPQTPSEPPVDTEQAKVGQKLVSMAGGLSCVTCHAVGSVQSQIFETAGINFALTDARVLKSYARYWIRNPQLIDPSTKMPLYWDEEGKSPISDIYGGDSAKQIEAIWEYLRLGEKMPPPPTP